MTYTLEKTANGMKVKFTLDGQEWEKAINDAYNKTKHKFGMGGFRKGKVPRKVIERIYGEIVFYEDAFNYAFPEYYDKMLEAEPQVYPVETPSVDFEHIGADGIVFTAQFAVKPEPKMSAYTGLDIKQRKAKVTLEQIENEIKSVQQRVSRKVSVTDRAAQDGDIVLIDYSGSVDGVKFDGGTAERQELEIGSHSFIPGFEEQIIGMEIGTKRDINVTFPAEYHSEQLKGKAAVFHIKLHEIMRKELPELDDEFAKEVSSFETFNEYRESIIENLTEAAERKAKSDNENAMLEAVTAGTEVDIPEAMVNTQLDYMLRDFEYRLMYQGMKLDDFFKMTNSSADDFKKDRRDEAHKIVKTRLALEAIVKAEKLDVTDEEAEERIKADAEKAGKPYEEYRKEITAQRVEFIKNDLLMERLMKFLQERNNIIIEEEQGGK